ncbi:hypothetical protein evm_007521 [Chilo suppressalis]|nr:hypothetical protein evm_007521 [Chilo suppressalis]
MVVPNLGQWVHGQRFFSIVPSMGCPMELWSAPLSVVQPGESRVRTISLSPRGVVPRALVHPGQLVRYTMVRGSGVGYKASDRRRGRHSPLQPSWPPSLCSLFFYWWRLCSPHQVTGRSGITRVVTWAGTVAVAVEAAVAAAASTDTATGRAAGKAASEACPSAASPSPSPPPALVPHPAASADRLIY